MFIIILKILYNLKDYNFYYYYCNCCCYYYYYYYKKNNKNVKWNLPTQNGLCIIHSWRPIFKLVISLFPIILRMSRMSKLLNNYYTRYYWQRMQTFLLKICLISYGYYYAYETYSLAKECLQNKQSILVMTHKKQEKSSVIY